MRHQERNVSDFDEIILHSPSAGPSGGNQVTSFIQAVTASLGFAMSAGWDWLPSMHRLWLRDYVEAIVQPSPFGFFGTLSGSIFFKMAMLLVLCPIMERLFMAFPPERVGRSPSPVLGNGLIWFALLTLLPGVWSCIAYGLAIAFSILISLLLDAVPAQSLSSFRLLCPTMAVPLLLFAMPPSAEIRLRIRRHQRQRLFSSRMKGVFLRNLLMHRFSLSSVLSRQGSVYLMLLLFPLMYGFQLLLDFSSGCPLVCLNRLTDPPLERHTFLILSGEMSGAFLASSLIAFFPRHSLLVPMFGLSLFGCGALLTTVFPAPPLNSVAFYAMQLASGCCAAFGLLLVHQFFQRSTFIFRNLSRALFLLTLYGTVGGYLLWSLAENIHNQYLTSHALFMLLMTLGSIAGVFFVYLIRRPLRQLLSSAPIPGPSLEDTLLVPVRPQDPFEQLTPREREVAELVQTGMKNLEISVRLNITETTLRVHLRRIYRKLGIQGRTNLREFNNTE